MSSNYRISVNPLDIADVVKILQEPPENKVSTLPPVEPKGGEIYLYRSNDDDTKGVFLLLNCVMINDGRVLSVSI